MKSRLATLTTTLAFAFLVSSIAACHHRARPAEGPVQKTKEVVKDVGHDAKETGRDIKNDLKK